MRIGKCNQCGQCCGFSRMFYNLTPQEKSALYAKIGQNKINNMLKTYFICPHLIAGTGDKKTRCDNHKNRPEFCRKFPNCKNDIKGIPECGYKFIFEK